MTEKEIIEANMQICEFMGQRGNWLMGSPKDMEYKTSWTWLMPVVDKIETLVLHKGLKEGVSAFVITICGDWCEIEMNTQYGMAFPEVDYEEISVSEKTKLEATWMAVVKFVQWYISYTALKKPREAKPNKKLRDEAQ